MLSSDPQLRAQTNILCSQNGGALGISQFRLDFGEMYKGQAVLPAKWQTAFNVMSSVGQFFGGIGSGFIADRIGRKWTMWAGSWILIIGIIMEVVATTRGVFVTAKLILGIALGFYLSMAPAYCSEVSLAPPSLKPFSSDDMPMKSPCLTRHRFLQSC
jgi:MFS family permease